MICGPQEMAAQESGQFGIALDQRQPLGGDAGGQQRLGDLAGAGAELDDMAGPLLEGSQASSAPWPGEQRPLGTTAPIEKGRRNQRFRKRAVPAWFERCHDQTSNRATQSTGKLGSTARAALRVRCDRGAGAVSNTARAWRICSSALTTETSTAAANGSDCTTMKTAHSRASGSITPLFSPQDERRASHSRTVSTASPRAMPSAMPSVARSSILGVRMKGSRLVARP